MPFQVFVRPAGEALHRRKAGEDATAAALHVAVEAAGEDARQVVGDGADGGGDRHFVVV